MNTAFPTRTPNGPSPLLPTGMCHDLIQKGLKTYVLTFTFIEVSTQVFGWIWNKAGFLDGGPTEHSPHTTHTTQCACMSINVPMQTHPASGEGRKGNRHAAELSNVNCCGMRHTHARASWCGRLGCVWHGSLKAHASVCDACSTEYPRTAYSTHSNQNVNLPLPCSCLLLFTTSLP